MKPFWPIFASFALAGLLATGCSKNEAADKSAVKGPITDSGSTGLKAVGAQAADAGDPKRGASIFATNCSSCHGKAGVGGGIGPVLKGEKVRKDYHAAIVWIKNPQPPMPKLFPAPLSESDVQDVAAYVETL